MAKYVCKTCGYVFDEEKGDEEYGIAPGTAASARTSLRSRNKSSSQWGSNPPLR